MRSLTSMKPDAFIILIPGFASGIADTTCLPAQQNFVNALKKTRPHLNIIVIAFQYPHKKSTYSLYGCKIMAVGGKGRSKLFRLLLWRRVWKQLWQLRSSYNIKGLLSFWYGECALVGNRFAKRYHIPHYCWMMGQDAKKDNSYVSRTGLKGNELIASSDFIQQEFKQNHGE
ncbi:MAG TPA: hypothetical protein VKH37_10215, partial [Ferruginibacter sp.]|nr:hypothetical protein [Ferruginibacter sp.]